MSSIIYELGLDKARDTIIGNDKIRGISGGERKRTAIAVQLISDPLDQNIFGVIRQNE